MLGNQIVIPAADPLVRSIHHRNGPIMIDAPVVSNRIDDIQRIANDIDGSEGELVTNERKFRVAADNASGVMGFEQHRGPDPSGQIHLDGLTKRIDIDGQQHPHPSIATHRVGRQPD